MKHAILLFALLALITASAQNYCDMVEIKKDEFTGRISKETPDVKMNDKKYFDVDFQMYNWGDRTRLSIYITNGFGCVTEDDAYVYFKLENGEVLKKYHSGDIDCGKYTIMWIDLSPKNIEFLKSSPLVSIRAWGTDRGGDYDIIEQNFFIDFLPCIE